MTTARYHNHKFTGGDVYTTQLVVEDQDYLDGTSLIQRDLLGRPCGYMEDDCAESEMD